MNEHNLEILIEGIRNSSPDIKPIEYLRIQKNKYFHEIAQYSQVGELAKKRNDPKILQQLEIIIHQTGNHYLMLASMNGKMPDDEGNELLKELTKSMFKIWESQGSPDETVYPKIDEMYLR